MKAYDLGGVTDGAWTGYLLLEDGRLFHVGLARARPPRIVNACAVHSARRTSRSLRGLWARLAASKTEPVEIEVPA